MKENLFILDIGNSRAKLSSYKNSTWEYCFSIQRQDYSKLDQLINEELDSDDLLIWTSVVEEGAILIRNGTIQNQFELKRSLIDLQKINYETPKTLGLDRYFACLGAISQTDKPCIVIDAGTALTIDLMTENGVFEGGIISPGLQLWEKSLHAHAPALPNVERIIPNTWPPKSTKDALQWGISGGFSALVNSMISQWKKYYPNADIFSTGGDGEWISRNISNCIYDRFLVEKGCLAFSKQNL